MPNFQRKEHGLKIPNLRGKKTTIKNIKFAKKKTTIKNTKLAKKNNWISIIFNLKTTLPPNLVLVRLVVNGA